MLAPLSIILKNELPLRNDENVSLHLKSSHGTFQGQILQNSNVLTGRDLLKDNLYTVMHFGIDYQLEAQLQLSYHELTSPIHLEIGFGGRFSEMLRSRYTLDFSSNPGENGTTSITKEMLVQQEENVSMFDES